MTAMDHHSGTDRITEVAEHLGWPDDTIVVNLQGDEPCMPPALVDQVAGDMAGHPDSPMTTLASPITDWNTLFDPHVVKVVIDSQGYALYFSRAPVPWHRDEFGSRDGPMPASVTFFRHIGLYAYRASLLREFVTWPPAPLEKAEALEQLRVLWHGRKIHVTEARQDPGHGVDTDDDVRKVEKALLAMH
jgi:3-deoxy-manno-octulosonate cytidylyltransferase (CMP-KDO synthetase)